MNSLELKLPPVALSLLIGAAMALVRLKNVSIEFQHSERYYLVLILVCLGFIFCILGVRDFRNAKTTVNPVRPETATQLVQTGIYSISRNPMYVGFFLLLLGWGVILGNLLALAMALTFIPYMNRFQIHPEERALQNLFGDEYAAYKARVRRWI